MIRHAAIAFCAGAMITGIAALIGRAPAVVHEKATACDRAIEAVDRKIAFHQQRFERSGWWIDLEAVTLAHLYRAHLTGSAHDYLAADRAIASAFERAAPGDGPFSARARVSFALHRLDRALEDLERADDLELRADLYFHLGRYREAEDAYVRLVAKKPTPNTLARLAHYRWKTGDFEAAESLLEAALARVPERGEPRAWLELSRGRIDLSRGRAKEAMAHFEAAEAAFEGWYLVDEHLAQAAIALDDHARAIAILRALADRTGNPEHLHALASELEATGDFARAAALHQRAKELFSEQIALLPEAFSAHALSHLLTHQDAAGSIEAAEANHRARPNAESLVLLSQAYASAGMLDRAEQAIREAIATPISTAELHATAALVLAKNDPATAASQRERALSIRSSAFDELAWLARAINRACGGGCPAPPASQSGT